MLEDITVNRKRNSLRCYCLVVNKGMYILCLYVRICEKMRYIFGETYLTNTATT